MKKVLISAMTYDGDAHVIYLDGHNNPGFSGAPVVYRDLNRSTVEFRVAAVVSGYRHDHDPTYRLQELKPGEERAVPRNRLVGGPPGKWFRLMDTDLVARSNTGIVMTYDIQHALDLIRQHPLGPELGKSQ